MKKRALFVDRTNAGLSQMAEALLTDLGGTFYQVESAGIAPSGIAAATVDAMRQIGIDITGYRAKSLSEYADQTFDLMILLDVSDDEVVQLPVARECMNWRIDEPGADAIERENSIDYTRARDELQQRINFLLLTERAATASV
jgi:protein-tyrosine-phosphatase